MTQRRISGIERHNGYPLGYGWRIKCIEGNLYFVTRKEAREFARSHPLKFASFIQNITPQETPFSRSK